MPPMMYNLFRTRLTYSTITVFQGEQTKIMSMRPPQYNMGRVDWIGAESVGVPGQRTFRLLANNSTMSAQLWLEKEELDALTKAIARMLCLLYTSPSPRD